MTEKSPTQPNADILFSFHESYKELEKTEVWEHDECIQNVSSMLTVDCLLTIFECVEHVLFKVKRDIHGTKCEYNPEFLSMKLRYSPQSLDWKSKCTYTLVSFKHDKSEWLGNDDDEELKKNIFLSYVDCKKRDQHKLECTCHNGKERFKYDWHILQGFKFDSMFDYECVNSHYEEHWDDWE